MAKLQLSISHTFVLDTDEWPQSELDTLYSQLGTERPSAEQLEDAIHKLLVDNDSEFWDEHIDLGEIDSQNVKVVCIDKSFNRFAKPDGIEKEDEEDVKTPPTRKQEVASKSEAKDTSSHPPKTSKPYSGPSTQPQGRQPTSKK